MPDFRQHDKHFLKLKKRHFNINTLTIGDDEMTAKAIIITKWHNKIHYHRRKAAWVKYPCDLIKDLSFRLASAEARALYPLLLCMAATSEDNTTGVLTVKSIEKETRIPIDQLISQLDELYECGLVKGYDEPKEEVNPWKGYEKLPPLTAEEEKAALERILDQANQAASYGNKKRY